MLSTVFSGLFDAAGASVISVWDFLLCLFSSLILGLIIALSYAYKTRYTKSFLVTLALMPAVVCVVIMMVNGNLGAGVAVAGAFSLVRFRSAPGTAKEIAAIFLSMGSGFISGMGYIFYAFLFTLLLCAVFLLYAYLNFGEPRKPVTKKILHITIPEDLDYTGVFEDIFSAYTSTALLTDVKTTNLGSLFCLTYEITLKDPAKEKAFIDKLRTRNGNLEIALSIRPVIQGEL